MDGWMGREREREGERGAESARQADEERRLVSERSCGKWQGGYGSKQR